MPHSPKFHDPSIFPPLSVKHISIYLLILYVHPRFTSYLFIQSPFSLVTYCIVLHDPSLRRVVLLALDTYVCPHVIHCPVQY